MPDESGQTAGTGEAEAAQVSQPEAQVGQSTPSPMPTDTPHEKLMAGLAAIRAEEKAAAEASTEAEEEAEAEETPTEGEAAPEQAEAKPEAEPTVAELRTEFNERMKGFQNAINEKDGQLRAALARAERNYQRLHAGASRLSDPRYG